MNYIKHLNRAFELIYDDDRLLPNHVSLYMALFHQWNLNRFVNPVQINRTEIMRASRIRSITTYTKNIKELHDWGYIQYQSSNNPVYGSHVSLSNFCNSTWISSYPKNGTVDGTVDGKLLYNINLNKHSQIFKHENAPEKNDVLIFFKENNWAEMEAEKFFCHYQANGWIMGNSNNPHKDWKAAAQKWVLFSPNFHQIGNRPTEPEKAKAGDLHVNQNKDYSEPL